MSDPGAQPLYFHEAGPIKTNLIPCTAIQLLKT